MHVIFISILSGVVSLFAYPIYIYGKELVDIYFALLPVTFFVIINLLYTFFRKNKYIYNLECDEVQKIRFRWWLSSFFIDIIFVFFLMFISALLMDYIVIVGAILMFFSIWYFITRNIFFKSLGFYVLKLEYSGISEFIDLWKILFSNLIIILPLTFRIYESETGFSVFKYLYMFFGVVSFFDILSILPNRNRTIDTFLKIQCFKKNVVAKGL